MGQGNKRIARRRRESLKSSGFAVQMLEFRRLLSAVNWTGTAGDNQWSTPGNWSSSPSLPGPGDDVTINVPGAPTIVLASGTQSIKSLVSDDLLTISGGTLKVTTLALISAELILDGGTILGGAINGSNSAGLLVEGSGSVLDGVTVDANIDASTFTNSVTINDGLTLNGAASFGSGSGDTDAQWTFGDSSHSASLSGNAVLTFGGAADNYIVNGTANTFTIGANVAISGKNGSFLNSNSAGNTLDQGSITENNTTGTISINKTDTEGAFGQFTNQGTISANVSGGILSINYVTNHGTIIATAGSFLDPENLTNSTNAAVSAVGSSLVLEGSLSNSGYITVTNSAVDLDGNFSQADLGTFIRNGGAVNITGTIYGDLTLDTNTGSWNLNGGLLSGGTFNSTGGSELNVTSGGIDDVVDGNVYVAGTLNVVGGIVLNGTLTLGNDSGTTSGILNFISPSQLINYDFGDAVFYAVSLADGDASLTGTGAVVLGGGSGDSIYNGTQDAIYYGSVYDATLPTTYSPAAFGVYGGHGYYFPFLGGTLTISGVTIRNSPTSVASNAALYSQQAGNIVDNGTIAWNGSGNSIAIGNAPINSVQYSQFYNSGNIEALGGASMWLAGLSNGGVSNLIVNSSSLELTGSLFGSSSSNFTATNSTINLNCANFTAAELGNFNSPGSTILLTGQLTGGITLSSTNSDWILRHGGTVNGGTIIEQNGSLFSGSTGGTLANVTIDGNLDLAGIDNPQLQQGTDFVNVGGSLTLNGTMYLGNLQADIDGEIDFNAGVNNSTAATLGGTGTVVFGGQPNADELVDSALGIGSPDLTIGAGITLRGMSGSVSQAQPSDQLIIRGTVDDDIAGGTLYLGNYSVTNLGSISATNGGNVTLTGIDNTLGKKISANNSSLTFAGTWVNYGTISSTNSTVNLGGTFTRAALGAFSRSGGTVNITGILNGGAALNVTTGSWTLLGGNIIGGRLDETNGTQLILSVAGGKLTGLTVNGNIDGTNNGSATILGGLVLNGTMTLGNAAGTTSASVYFGNNALAGSLTGNATVILNSDGGFITNLSTATGAAGTLTIGPAVTIEGSYGFLSTYSSNSTILNQGIIDADSAGGGIQLGSGNGEFTNQGTVEAEGGAVVLADPFDLEGQGTLGSNWLGNVIVGGRIYGGSIGSAGSDLRGVVRFQGGSSATNPQLLEVMSDDLGDTAAGFTNNFVYGTLDQSTAYLKLVDQYDNAPGTGAEALYANSLVVPNGVTLDLNGLHVYAKAAELDGSVINGTVTLYPDGGPLAINSPLPGAISTVGEVDTWTFYGLAGQVITTYVNPGTGSAPVPINPNLNWANVQLLGPANQVLASGASADLGDAVSLSGITLPTSGTYTIQISAPTNRASSKGNYVVAAFDVSPRVSSLTLGQNETGSINTPFDLQQWTFSAIAGEQVRFNLNNETSSGLNYTLSGPNSFSGFSKITGNSALVDLTSTGTYTLTAQGTSGATGKYSFVINPTTQTTVPLNGSVNGSLAGPGQAELFTISVPTVQTLVVNLTDASSTDSNEMYLRFGSPPTRDTYDYRYANADSANQNILVPSAAIGTWYVLIYTDNVPSPSTFTLSANGYSLRLTGSFPAALGNSAPETISITGAGFEPGTTAELIGSAGTYTAITNTVVSFTQIYASFPAGLPTGVYSIQANQGSFSDALNAAFTVTAGGAPLLQTALDVPAELGRHIGATLYVTYSNAGTVAMPAPLLTLESTDPNQVPLLTLDSSLISQGLRTSTVPPGFSTSIQILASGEIPGILEPGESIKIPVYYAGLLKPWDTGDTGISLNLSDIDTTDSGIVDWNSYKSELAPADVPAIAWNQIFSNLTSQIGTTWGQYVAALDSNALYLGGLGENISDVNSLWNFMYMQADDALGPVEHLNTVFDSTLPLPDGNSLSFWRNYHLAISGRDAFGMLGYGWSVPYQSSLSVQSDGSVDQITIGEDTNYFQSDTQGGYFPDDDGDMLTLNTNGTYTVASSGGSDTYSANGQLSYHSDPGGDIINYSYNSNGQLISLASGTGQSITLAYNTAGLLGTLTDSQGNVTAYGYDSTNQYLTRVSSFAGTTSYGYDLTSHALTSIQNVDGTYSDISYDTMGRLASLASATSSTTFSYPQLGQISGTDALGNVVSEFYNENDLIAKSLDALGNPTYFTHDANGDVVQMTNAVGVSFSYSYDSSGNLTRITNPLGHSTSFTYNADGETASMTDANNNVTTYRFDANGNASSITYPDGSMETVTLNAQNQPILLGQTDGNAIAYTYDSNGDVASETFSDGSNYAYTYNKYGSMLTATDSGGTTAFTYDSTGRTTSVTYPNNTSLTYTYDTDSRPSTIVDQSGYTIRYVYNSAGEPSETVDGSGNMIASFTYDAMGRAVAQNNANGTYTTITYDGNGNVLHLVNYAPGGAANSRFDYTYNNLGQMSSMSTLDGTWQYGDDAAGQLVRAIFTSTNPAIPNQDLAYNYDAVGNRVSTVINGVTTTYVANSMNQYTSIGGTLQQYDGNGNLIFDGTSAYTYDDLNELTGISSPSGTSQFTYNALGQRTSSTVNGVTTQFLNDPAGSGSVIAEYDGGGNLLTHFNYGPSGPISQTTASGANYFYDADQLGSVVGLSNSSGGYVDRYSYLPYGESLASSGSMANPYQFLGGIGIITDTSNSLHMGAREYSLTSGVFNSTDPLQYLAGNTNFYAYAFNQPTQVVDPSGLESEGKPFWDLAKGRYDNLVDQVSDPLSIGSFNTEEEDELEYEDLGPLYETVVDTVEDIIFNQELPSAAQVFDNFSDKIFDKLNVGPFQIGLIEKTLLQPEFAVNVVDGINAIRRAGLCGTSNAGEAKQLIQIGLAPPGCANAPGLVRPTVPTKAGKTASTAIASSFDPNDKIGPTGFGSSDFVAAGSLLPYRIDFENATAATAPAQEVDITDPLSIDDDLSSFRITEIGWGDTVIDVPANSQHFQSTVPMTYDGVTFDVSMQIGINLLTGLISAQFLSIDPTTDLPPGVLIGFLPPEDGTGRGMGYISYVVATKPNLPTGTQIRNVANVSFDEEEIIATDQVSETDPAQGTDPDKEALVTIDSVAPTSTVAALPATTNSTTINVNWSGQDDVGGSGIAVYNIFVSNNGGAFTEWLSDTTQTSSTYTGLSGHTYGFYSTAVDNVGNVQATPSGAQATTSVMVGSPLNLSGPAFYLKLDADGQHLDIWQSADGTGSEQQVLLNSVSSISASGTTGNDIIVIDFSAGNPLPGSGLSYTGAGSGFGDALKLIGSAGNDFVNVTSSEVLFDGALISFSSIGNLILAQGTGTDGLTIQSGTLMLASALNANNPVQRSFSAITIGPGADLIVNAASAAPSRAVLNVQALSIAGSLNHWTGKLDLNNNDLILQSPNIATLTNQIAEGFDGGRWDGMGVTSSAAAFDTTHLRALGSMLNTADGTTPIYGATTPLGPFDGFNPTAQSVLVKYTYFGDANLDGMVNSSDYVRIDNGLINHLTGWANGDFDYTQSVDGSDYALIDNAFNTQGAALSDQVAIVAAQASAIPSSGTEPKPAIKPKSVIKKFTNLPIHAAMPVQRKAGLSTFSTATQIMSTAIVRNIVCDMNSLPGNLLQDPLKSAFDELFPDDIYTGD